MRRRCATLCALLALAFASGSLGQQLRDELEPCRLTADEGRREVDALCATLAVPLDPETPQGPRVELFVAVVEALAEDPAADPLAVIAGGPGDAATRFFAANEAAFERILRRRDVLLMDQRGSGASSPLHCEKLEQATLLDTVGADADELAALALDCLRTTTRNPRFFTTSLAVADLDLVRAALGYERLNLYAISYGTRVAQHYVRRFPQRVRSVVLDGVLPTTMAMGPAIALQSQAALLALFDRCADETACAAAYPQLREHFKAVLSRLREAPAAVSFQHPRTGATFDLTVDHTVIAGVVRLLLYQSAGTSLLPPLIEAAYRGDYRQWAAQAYVINEALRHLATGLNYAVTCTEDVPFWGKLGEREMAAQARTFMGTTFVDVALRVCRSWPAGILDEDLRQPLASAAPTLLLSGERDPITPPNYAEKVAQGLTNSVSVVAAGLGHGMLTVPCVQQVIAEFIENADPATLDWSCVERTRPVPLFTSALGPAP